MIPSPQVREAREAIDALIIDVTLRRDALHDEAGYYYTIILYYNIYYTILYYTILCYTKIYHTILFI